MLPTTTIITPVIVCAWCDVTIKDGDTTHGIALGTCKGCADKQRGVCPECGDEGVVGAWCTHCGLITYANWNEDTRR